MRCFSPSFPAKFWIRRLNGVVNYAIWRLLLVRPFEFMRIITSFLLFGVVTASAQTRDYPKTPKDRPVHAEGTQQMTDIERAAQPYIAKARKTYPAAKKRF